jgi:predicted nucleic acid-binding protein
LARVVVADAGPLIAFGRIGRLDLLGAVLGDVAVPEAVLAECLIEPLRPGAAAIATALAAGRLRRIPDPEAPSPPFAPLGAGESAVIRVGLALPAPVLMDDRAGRAVAHNLHVDVIGSAGVLLAAKRRGLLASVAPVIDAFQANGYHLSANLVEAVLARAGEQTSATP